MTLCEVRIFDGEIVKEWLLGEYGLRLDYRYPRHIFLGSGLGGIQSISILPGHLAVLLFGEGKNQ